MSDTIVTPEFRVSYPQVFTPQKNDLNGSMEYSVVAIFPKGADLSSLKRAAEAAIVKKLGTDKTKWPQNMRSPFRKCSEKWKTVTENGVDRVVMPKGYEDGDATWITFRAKEAYKPAVVGPDVKPIIEPKDFYAGCYALASINAYYYDQKGNRGVSIGLNNVQKVRDGEPLGGVSRPQDDFKAVEGAAAAGGTGGASVFD